MLLLSYVSVSLLALVLGSFEGRRRRPPDAHVEPPPPPEALTQSDDSRRPTAGITTATGSIHFLNKGTIAAGLSWAHVVVNSDTSRIPDTIELLCDSVDLMDTYWRHATSKTSRGNCKIFELSAERCKGLRDKLRYFHKIWDNNMVDNEGNVRTRGAREIDDEEQESAAAAADETGLVAVLHRKKRQVVIAGIAAVAGIAAAVAGIAATFSAIFSHQDLSEIVANQKRVVRVLDNVNSRLQISERGMRILNDTVRFIGENEDFLELRQDALTDALLINQAIDVADSEVDRFLQGVFELEQHRLSPSLLRNDQLDPGLDYVKAELASEGFISAITTAADLFKMHTSHIFFPNLTLSVIIHIPAYKAGSLLYLKQFLPFPLHIPDPDNELDGHYVVPQMEQTLFAVTKDNSYQVSLRPEELEACTTYGELQYCPELTVFKRRSTDGCLAALYNRDESEIAERCHWRIGPVDDYAIQLASHDYLLFHAGASLVRKSCVGEPDVTEMVSGARQVNLPARCTISTNSFKFEGQLDIAVYAPTLTIHGFNFTSTLLERADGDSDVMAHLRKLALVGTDQGMTIHHIADDFAWHKTLGYAAWGTGVVGLLTVGLAVFCCCKLYRCGVFSPGSRGDRAFSALRGSNLMPGSTAESLPGFWERRRGPATCTRCSLRYSDLMAKEANPTDPNCGVEMAPLNTKPISRKKTALLHAVQHQVLDSMEAYHKPTGESSSKTEKEKEACITRVAVH